MLKKEFIKKYDTAIRSMAIANDVDMSVGRDMLIYEIKCRAGIMDRADTYAGVPDNLDWDMAIVDYKSITD